MARVVSLTLFLLSWLLLFSYAAAYARSIECQVCTKVVDHIHQQVQEKEAAQICPEKVTNVFALTNTDDFLCKIRPLIGQLANDVCHNLYPDACSVKTPSTKDGIHGQPLGPNPSNNGQMVNMDSKQKIKKYKGRKFFPSFFYEVVRFCKITKEENH